MTDSIFGMFSDTGSEHSESPETIESVSFGEEKIFVVSVGGSIIAGEKPNTSFIARFSESISKLRKKGFKFVLVAGGGKIGRTYISAAKNLGANNYQLDEIGISASRLNAWLLISAIEDAFPVVLTEPRQAVQVIAEKKVPVFGGLLPGLTTDGVAVLIAESLSADFINLTNVDGVYNKDPAKHKNARLYSMLSPSQLLNLISSKAKTKPGQNIVLDLTAVQIIKRSAIKTIVLNGNDLKNFEDAIKGRHFTGTIIQENSYKSSDL